VYNILYKTRPLLLILLLCYPLCFLAQGGQKEGMSVRNVQYMVRRGDRLEDIASRFHVPLHQLLKINKINTSKFVAYPGKVLSIPVYVRDKVWDPSHDIMSESNLPLEDRGHGVDYEVIEDLDDVTREDDFINVIEIREDSIEFSNISLHLSKIDQRIKNIQTSIDSIKKNEFAFTFDEKDKSAILEKMKAARDKYYLEGPLGKTIDSLRSAKTRLLQRHIRLHARITEYEDLVNNAEYNQHNFVLRKIPVDALWADPLKYQSKYVDGKLIQTRVGETDGTTVNVKQQNKDLDLTEMSKVDTSSGLSVHRVRSSPHIDTAVARASAIVHKPIATDTGSPVSTHIIHKDTVVATIIPAYADIRAKAEGVKSPSADRAAIVDALEIKERADSTVEEDVVVSKYPIIDFALLAPLTLDNDIAQIDQVELVDMIYTTTVKAYVVVPKTESQPISGDTKKAEGDSGSAYVSTSEVQPYMLKEEKNIYNDPTIGFYSDSNVTKGVKVQDIELYDSKKQPKYLMPVDTTTKIKGDFYMIRARQELEKGDFKSGEKYLRKSLDINPNNATAWMLHADIYLAVGVPDQALKDYLISSQIDSTNSKVFYNMALVYTAKGDNQKAYNCFTKAIGLNSKYQLAYMGRASLLLDQHDALGAIDDYNQVLSMNKYYTPAFKARGMAKMELKKYADAILDFDQFLEIEEKDAFVIYERGIAKALSNNLLQGCLDLSTARDLGFKDAEKAMKKFCQ